MKLDNNLIITTISGSLNVGDVITFEGPYWPWYIKLWYAIRYMKHNNPTYKSKRQFVVTWGNGNTNGIESNETSETEV